MKYDILNKLNLNKMGVFPKKKHDISYVAIDAGSLILT
jgi:hypothetical protein